MPSSPRTRRTKVVHKIPKSATDDERMIALARRLGLDIGPLPLSPTQWIRLWADIGLSLSEKEPEFRTTGRRRGVRPTSEDWQVLRIVETLSTGVGCSFDEALRKSIPALKQQGFLSRAAAHNTHAQRIRRLKKKLDNDEPILNGMSLANLVRIWELRHKK